MTSKKKPPGRSNDSAHEEVIKIRKIDNPITDHPLWKQFSDTDHPLWKQFSDFITSQSLWCKNKKELTLLFESFEAGASAGCTVLAHNVVQALLGGKHEFKDEFEKLSKEIDEAAREFTNSQRKPESGKKSSHPG